MILGHLLIVEATLQPHNFRSKLNNIEKTLVEKMFACIFVSIINFSRKYQTQMTE